MTTETRVEGQEGPFVARDLLEYANVTAYLLGEPLDTFRNREIRRVGQEKGRLWVQWYDKARAEGHITENGHYYAAKVVKEGPLPLPPQAALHNVRVFWGDVDNYTASDAPFLRVDTERGVIELDPNQPGRHPDDGSIPF